MSCSLVKKRHVENASMHENHWLLTAGSLDRPVDESSRMDDTLWGALRAFVLYLPTWTSYKTAMFGTASWVCPQFSTWDEYSSIFPPVHIYATIFETSVLIIPIIQIHYFFLLQFGDSQPVACLSFCSVKDWDKQKDSAASKSTNRELVFKLSVLLFSKT